MKAKLFLIILFSFILASVLAQEQNPYEGYLKERLGARQFEKEEWEKAKEGLDFSEEAVRKKEPKAKEKGKEEAGGGGQYERPERESNSFRVDSELAAGILEFISILILAIVLALILRGVLGLENNPRNKKIKPKEAEGLISLEKIEENIHETDLEAFIRRALQQEAYPMALRLYYLAILKELSLRKAIRWKKDKTNRQYVQEMRQSPLSGAFEEVTHIFERAWYGGRPLGKEQFRFLEPKFRALAGQAKAGQQNDR